MACGTAAYMRCIEFAQMSAYFGWDLCTLVSPPDTEWGWNVEMKFGLAVDMVALLRHWTAKRSGSEAEVRWHSWSNTVQSNVSHVIQKKVIELKKNIKAFIYNFTYLKVKKIRQYSRKKWENE